MSEWHIVSKLVVVFVAFQFLLGFIKSLQGDQCRRGNHLFIGNYYPDRCERCGEEKSR